MKKVLISVLFLILILGFVSALECGEGKKLVYQKMGNCGQGETNEAIAMCVDKNATGCVFAIPNEAKPACWLDNQIQSYNNLPFYYDEGEIMGSDTYYFDTHRYKWTNYSANWYSCVCENGFWEEAGDTNQELCESGIGVGKTLLHFDSISKNVWINKDFVEGENENFTWTHTIYYGDSTGYIRALWGTYWDIKRMLLPIAADSFCAAKGEGNAIDVQTELNNGVYEACSLISSDGICAEVQKFKTPPGTEIVTQITCKGHKKISTGFCCGDDCFEHFVDGEDGTSACCDSPNKIVINGKCVEEIHDVGVEVDAPENVSTGNDVEVKVKVKNKGNQNEEVEVEFAVEDENETIVHEEKKTISLEVEEEKEVNFIWKAIEGIYNFFIRANIENDENLIDNEVIKSVTVTTLPYQCVDSDGGLNYEVAGKASLQISATRIRSYVDGCKASSTDFLGDFDNNIGPGGGPVIKNKVTDYLYEAVCENNKPALTIYECNCYNGECIE